jgi:hypothetical protein
MSATPFRQIHLDFHTSEAIPGIGSRFHPAAFQQSLITGRVNSITLFSKCHHGWSYHPTQHGVMHPELSFDLLGAMVEAAQGIGVKTPIYLSGGYDERIAREHTHWLLRDKEDRTWVPDFMQPGYHLICLNTPYLDLLVNQVREAALLYPGDGIFLDIVKPRPCWCQYCRASMRQEDMNPADSSEVERLSEQIYERYASSIRAAVDEVKPGMHVIHNNGHIRRGRRDLAKWNTHQELESLPTGGWGYDHFPISARYVQGWSKEYIGMTGKFHTRWGEFGGFKHWHALWYETSLYLAHGAKCSIGDQMHPSGVLEEAAYEQIGKAYRLIEAKEPWCTDVEAVVDIGILSVEAVNTTVSYGKYNQPKPDIGAARILFERQYLFDVLDTQSDFTPYRVIILPDEIRLNEPLRLKLQSYVEQGGRILASGESGLDQNRDEFVLDLGIAYEGKNKFQPDYVVPDVSMVSMREVPLIMYGEGSRITIREGEAAAMAHRVDPYFNRTMDHFCSHQHAPSTLTPSGPGMTESAGGIYVAWKIFEDYAVKGSLHLKELIGSALDRLLEHRKTIEVSLPSQGIATVMRQDSHHRYIVHLLYAVPVKRGAGIEAIEDIVPLYQLDVLFRAEEVITAVRLEPQGEVIPFRQQGVEVRLQLPKLECHQMVVLEYEDIGGVS